MRSIVKSIHDNSVKAPEKVAIVGTDHTVNYSTLWKMVTAMAFLLKRKGIEVGDRIILEANHTVEFLVICYGIHLAGAVHVPVEHKAPKERIADISKEIQPQLILVGEHPIDNFNVSLMELLDMDESDYSFPEEDMIQEILFTTGTTGKSKGVIIKHGAQMNMCESQNAVLDYSEDNMWLIPTPMNHAAGLRKTHMSMVRGSSVILMEGFTNLRLFFDNLKKHKVTSIYLPPAGVHYILMLGAKELAKYNEQLDFIYSSSSALPSGDKEKLIEILPDVRKFDAYGGSEVGAVCYIDYNSVKNNTKCVGKANPGVDIFIVDEEYNKKDSSYDDPGIIAIKSNTVTAGYWNEPELTDQTIRNGIIYMSDLGYIEDGYLYLVGRRDDVINIGGYKVAPTEVEDIALKHPMINECVCSPYEDRMFGRIIKLYICLNDGFEFNADELTQYLESRLEAYKVPKVFECLESIPKTYNGKIDRKILLNK